MNDANLASENISGTFLTSVEGSDLVQWKPITMISDIGESALKTDEASIEIMDDGLLSNLENNKWVMAIFVIFLNLLVTFVTVKLMVSRQDGMQRIGWSSANVMMDGKNREVFLPVFIKTADYQELNGGTK